jgi:AraC-like DNA-binding protein
MDIARVSSPVAARELLAGVSKSYLVLLLLRGRCEVGAAGVLHPGELVIERVAGVDLELEPGGDLILVSIPEPAVGPHGEALSSAAGRPLPTSHGTVGLVAQLLLALVEQPEGYRTAHPGRLAQYLLGILSLACLDDRVVEGVSWHSKLLRRAMQYVEDHLGELDLTPDRIAEVQNVSTRTLHRLFRREGLTVSGWIRSRRLERCRQELADPAFAEFSVSAIGTRWGLCDAAHFSRSFKSAYGTSPAAYRTRLARHGWTEPPTRTGSEGECLS